jgi:hypothetical protein
MLLPSCKIIERISLAYCLLLSYAFCDTRFNSHGRSVVFSTICSARGGMNDSRFSRTPRIWNTPWESVSSFSSNLLRFATSKSSRELFSYSSAPSLISRSTSMRHTSSSINSPIAILVFVAIPLPPASSSAKSSTSAPTSSSVNSWMISMTSMAISVFS